MGSIACPTCRKASRVVDSRPRLDGGILRRRKCLKGHTFNTIEILANNPGTGTPWVGGAVSAAKAVTDTLNGIQRMLDRAKKKIAKDLS